MAGRTCVMSVAALALFVVFACDKYAMAVAILGVFQVIIIPNARSDYTRKGIN